MPDRAARTRIQQIEMHDTGMVPQVEIQRRRQRPLAPASRVRHPCHEAPVGQHDQPFGEAELSVEIRDQTRDDPLIGRDAGSDLGTPAVRQGDARRGGRRGRNRHESGRCKEGRGRIAPP
jgi:hypothetical protein